MLCNTTLRNAGTQKKTLVINPHATEIEGNEWFNVFFNENGVGPSSTLGFTCDCSFPNDGPRTKSIGASQNAPPSNQSMEIQ